MPSYLAPLQTPPPVMLTPHSRASLGSALRGLAATAPASVVLGTGNVAVAYGLLLDAPALLQKAFVMNGATINGNWDVGLYSYDWRLLLSTGTTAQAGANVLQEVDITDYAVAPGRYHLAFAYSSATAAYFTTGTTSLINGGGGANVMTTAFPLPATYVSIGATNAVVLCGFACRTLAV